MSKKLLIGIGTYNRNNLLERTLEHIANLDTPENCAIEVVISDNNPNQEAKVIHNKLQKEFPFSLHYTHEPQKSIAAVRNAVLKKAIETNADYIAFIDDDEYPLQNWITELYKTMINFDADGATSYAQHISENTLLDIPPHIKRRKNGSIRKICITNSVLFKTDIIKKYNLWFDTDFGLMTGEDVDFFSRATQKGCKFVWCDKILLIDTIVDGRKNFDWQLDRAFNNGYLKIFAARKAKKNIQKKYNKAIFDLVLFSIITLFTIFLPQKYQHKCLLKLMDCLGKIRSFHSTKAYTHYKRD